RWRTPRVAPSQRHDHEGSAELPPLIEIPTNPHVERSGSRQNAPGAHPESWIPTHGTSGKGPFGGLFSCGTGHAPCAPSGVEIRGTQLPKPPERMISRHDIQRLLHQEREGPVLSVFLDMSVDSDNKRTYDVFLQKRKGEFAELDSDREGHHREALGEAFARVEAWLENEFDDSKKGVALYTGIGPDWLEAL